MRGRAKSCFLLQDFSRVLLHSLQRAIRALAFEEYRSRCNAPSHRIPPSGVSGRLNHTLRAPVWRGSDKSRGCRLSHEGLIDRVSCIIRVVKRAGQNLGQRRLQGIMGERRMKRGVISNLTAPSRGEIRPFPGIFQGWLRKSGA